MIDRGNAKQSHNPLQAQASADIHTPSRRLARLPLSPCVLVARRKVGAALRQRAPAVLLPHLKQAGQHHAHRVAQAHRLCGGGAGWLVVRRHASAM